MNAQEIKDQIASLQRELKALEKKNQPKKPKLDSQTLNRLRQECEALCDTQEYNITISK